MLFVYWITRDCNLRCDYCYLNKVEKYMDEKVLKKAVDFSVKKIRENKDGFNEVNNIVLHGGEPTLNFDAAKKIVNEYKSIENENMKFKFEMTTNGTFTNDEIINFVKENDISLSVSVDGTKEEHDRHRKFKNGQGSFDKVIKNLLRYKEAGIHVRVRMTVTPETIDHIFENYMYFYNLGFRTIPFILDLYNTKWSKEHVQEYYENQKKIIDFLKINNYELFVSYLCNLTNNIHRIKGICGGGEREFSINYNGDLYPCSFSMGNEDYIIGNVFDGIDKKRLSEIHDINIVKNEACDGCGFYSICSGTRCKILNKTITGEYYMPNPITCHKNAVIKRIEKEYENDLLKNKKPIEEFRKYIREKKGVGMI